MREGFSQNKFDLARGGILPQVLITIIFSLMQVPFLVLKP